MSDIASCATCRFMAEPRGIDYIGDNVEDDRTSDHRTCVRIIHGNGDAEREDGTMAEPALVIDGSGYAARLIVLPTFGCVLHEPKEPGHG